MRYIGRRDKDTVACCSGGGNRRAGCFVNSGTAAAAAAGKFLERSSSIEDSRDVYARALGRSQIMLPLCRKNFNSTE